jgi:membrane-associated phospholipid phosphatase
LSPDTETTSVFRPEHLGGHVVQFLEELGHDYSNQLQVPFRYARRDPARFIIGAVGLGTIIVTDHATQKILVPEDMTGNRNMTRRAERVSRLADTRSSYPLVLGFFAVGVVARSPRERETAVMLAEALVTSATWTFLLKEATGRERPRETDGRASDWTGPGGIFDDDAARQAKPRSFPSGHATGIWAAATILAHQYPSHRVVPVLVYGAATAVSYSRMVVEAHWLSDVVVGGFIGYGCAKQVLSAHRDKRLRSEEPGVRVGMYVSGNHKGISLRYDF